MAIRLRWKREERKTGLQAVGAGPRGFYYHDGDNVYARVSPLGGDWRGPLSGWYWVAGLGPDLPNKNTCGKPCKTIGEAKKQAADYVKQHRRQRPSITRRGRTGLGKGDEYGN